MPFPLTKSSIANAILLSCQQEIQAFKPGNVSVWSEGHDMTVQDFYASAEQSAPFLATSGVSVGKRILTAAKATYETVGCNTNLGILLLSAPLAVAAELDNVANITLQQRVQLVMSGLDQRDAESVFAAIRLAHPGGLGDSEQHDVNQTVDCSLLDAMAEAQHRDRIAWQYCNDFNDIFQIGVPAIKAWLEPNKHPCQGMEWAVVSCYLKLMAAIPDTHITRKYGAATSKDIQKHAIRLEKRFNACQNMSDTVKLLTQSDHDMKREGINPGTSADLTVASVLAFNLGCSVYIDSGSTAG